MAEKINAKLGYTPQPEEDRDLNGDAETFKRYEEELEINDFPQTARWKVTSKVCTGKILKIWSPEKKTAVIIQKLEQYDFTTE